MPFTFKSTSNHGKPSFMLSFHEIMKLHRSTRILVEPKLVNSKLAKIKQAIKDYFKKDQTNMLRTYRKLNFYSTFKTDISRSENI